MTYVLEAENVLCLCFDRESVHSSSNSSPSNKECFKISWASGLSSGFSDNSFEVKAH